MIAFHTNCPSSQVSDSFKYFDHSRKLGPAQERRLHFALSTDDLLYRQFRRMSEDLEEARLRFLVRPTRIREVLGIHRNGIAELMRIKHVDYSPHGIRVAVELPPEKGKKS